MILTNYIICTSVFKSFLCIWPNDDLLRPKLLANMWNNKIKINLCQTEYIFYIILILYFNTTGCPLPRLQHWGWLELNVEKTKCLFMPFDILQCQNNRLFKMWQVKIFWNGINKFTLRKWREYERIKFVEHLVTILSRIFLSFRLQCNNSKIKVYRLIISLVLCTRKKIPFYWGRNMYCYWSRIEFGARGYIGLRACQSSPVKIAYCGILLWLVVMV